MARKIAKRQGKQLELGHKVDCTALYIRVSSEQQVKEGYSLEDQEKRLRAYCEAQGWPVCADQVYVDAGLSGKSTAGREAFGRMLQAAERGDIKRVVASKLDRIARNTKDFLGIVDTLQSYGCDLVLIKESFDTSTPQGKFFMVMTAAMAEFELSTIAERTFNGKVQKASEGGYNGSAIPLGYSFQGKDKPFAIDQNGAETVRSIFQWFCEGVGMANIANRLNLKGVGTAKGGKWYASTVKYILSNGLYAGLAQWDDVETVGAHPPIISTETYEQAHARMLTIKPGKPAT